jgi:hypothetical protein
VTPRIAIALVMVAGNAAAEVTPLSKLPANPAQLERGDVQLPDELAKALNDRSPRGVTVALPPPYCGQGNVAETWTSGDVDYWGARAEIDIEYLPRVLGMERLIERDGHAELERTRAVATDAGIVTERRHIALTRVGHAGAATIYAYRYGSMVFVIVPSHDPVDVRRDIETAALQGGEKDWRSSVGGACGFAITWLRVDKQGSQIGEFVGNYSKCYDDVTASITKTSRDREPLLAVSVWRGRCP